MNQDDPKPFLNIEFLDSESSSVTEESPPPAPKPKSSGVFYLLAAALLVAIVGAPFAAKFFRQEHQEKRGRIERDFLHPWTQGITSGDLRHAWQTVTTEDYRHRNPSAAVSATYAQCLRQWGRPEAIEIVRARRFQQPGDPESEEVTVFFQWPEAHSHLYIDYLLVNSPAHGYRLNAVQRVSNEINRLRKYADTPEGPW